MADPHSPSIYVLAGTNGAGKSSIAGAMFLRLGGQYFNPDEAARRILAVNTGITPFDANSAAWHEGKRLLEIAIAERRDFAFETTLGGQTIPTLLETAATAGIAVRIWYVGLRNCELHIERVRKRVIRGGHDIPEDRIRQRYDSSRLNLIRLLPRLTEFRLYDNSEEADPHTGATPEPLLILHLLRRKVMSVCDLTIAPDWVKPILAAGIRLAASFPRIPSREPR